MNINDLVARYLETWNETDPAARRKAIDELWAPGGVYTDPIATAGRDQIDATIAAVQEQFAGLAFTLAGPVDARPTSPGSAGTSATSSWSGSTCSCSTPTAGSRTSTGSSTRFPPDSPE